MNSVSYIDGKMFYGNHSEIYDFLNYIKRITGDKSWKIKYGSGKEKTSEGLTASMQCD